MVSQERFSAFKATALDSQQKDTRPQQEPDADPSRCGVSAAGAVLSSREAVAQRQPVRRWWQGFDPDLLKPRRIELT